MGPIVSTVVAVLIVALAVGGAIAYIIKAKKSGKKCIGCPDSVSCSKEKCSGACHTCSCGCSSQSTKNSEENEQQ